ncbi:MAG: hypothetical protein KAT04_06555 [Methylococcales bacterium]|nr:hypothetical protein [Methylococcales bacterium]
MGAIVDLVDLVTKLTGSVKDREFASELRNIQSMIGAIQSEHAKIHEQRIELMTENAELKQTIISLKQEILDIKQNAVSAGNQSTNKISKEEEQILVFLTKIDGAPAEQISHQLSFDITKTKYWLNKLIEEDMLSFTIAMNSPSPYFLIQGGREYLVKNGLI